MGFGDHRMTPATLMTAPSSSILLFARVGCQRAGVILNSPTRVPGRYDLGRIKIIVPMFSVTSAFRRSLMGRNEQPGGANQPLRVHQEEETWPNLNR
jgi:hypothetical protein